VLKNMLVTSQDERSWQNFLNNNPEPVGWLFAMGISPATLVRPQFRLGSDFVVDFMIVDTPQWTQVTLVEIESPASQAFKPDGKHGPKLVEAVAQTVAWKSWARNEFGTFRKEVVKAILELDNFGSYEALYKGRVLPNIAAGNFSVVTAIVIGRRNELHPNERNQHVVNFLRESNQSMIYSFDAIAESCGNVPTP
jgi:hypothetical protein